MDENSALLTDLYQLTMAYSYWQLGMAEREAVFHLFTRRNLPHIPYTIACGLTHVIDYLNQYQFTQDEIEYLASLKTPNNNPLFSRVFLDYLQQLKFQCQIAAVPEGTLVFPYEPILRVQGPLLQCQLIETALVNLITYGSLIATKTSIVCRAAKSDPVIEFGLRRTHGPNGALMAARSAFIGGCESTSNTLAGKTWEIPVKGTMAHSYIMAFENELTAFENFAKTMPENTILLVDTYDTVKGVQHAITIGKKLREQKQELWAIRLDSGDLCNLSQKARQMLDEAGLTQTKILASGDLDEKIIRSLKQKKARIDAWGVGTKMMTASDKPYLDTVYKLSAIRNPEGNWRYTLKRSESRDKMTNPGIPQIRRYYQQQRYLKDVIYDIKLGVAQSHPAHADHYDDLLVPIFEQGILVYTEPALTDIQQTCRINIKQFFASKRKDYPVELEAQLQKEKERLLAQ